MKALTAALAAMAASGLPAIAGETWHQQGFDMPESALYLTGIDRIVISNIAGHPAAADGNGYLSLLTPDGAVAQARWVAGLDAPKGMAQAGGDLLVADLTRLHVIDLKTGTIRQSIPVPGAKFLNDVTSDGDRAWITDFMADTIWEYRDGALIPLMTDPALSHPNGILYDGDRLLVGSWGQGMHEDFSTDTPGNLLSVDLDSRAITVLAPELGNLDGVARIGDTILTNDWITGAVFSVTADGAQKVFQLPAGLADISAHGDLLFLPLMLDGQMQAMRY